MTCLCRSHKWVCAYVSCATSNCKVSQYNHLLLILLPALRIFESDYILNLFQADSQAAIDEVYTKCGAILSSRSRLPTTDYVPVHEHPSEAEVSKSKYCMKTCFDQGKQLGSCASGNLDCVCKSHAAVCAWAKCSETNCQVSFLLLLRLLSKSNSGFIDLSTSELAKDSCPLSFSFALHSRSNRIIPIPSDLLLMRSTKSVELLPTLLFVGKGRWSM